VNNIMCCNSSDLLVQHQEHTVKHLHLNNMKSFPNLKAGPLGDTDLRFLSPQPDTSFYTARPRIQG